MIADIVGIDTDFRAGKCEKKSISPKKQKSSDERYSEYFPIYHSKLRSDRSISIIMSTVMKVVNIFIFSLVLLLVLGINNSPVFANTLLSNSEQCRQEVIEVVPGVYVAVGYGANSTLIEGDDGVIIVDTTGGIEAAQQVLSQFRKITPKPVKAIIYTHSHRDHTGGAKVFSGDEKIDIYARANFLSEGLKLTKLKRIYETRTYREHGFNLSPEERGVNVMLGKEWCKPNSGKIEAIILPPNHTFDQNRLAREIAGVKLELVAAPGETDDQLYVWLPEKKVLLCGDNYYPVFPNLYAIKGSYRDIFQWIDSLEAMLREHPKYLIPGHGMPVLGAENIKQVLRDYRDALRSVIEQTLAGMDRGLTPDRLVEVVKLPPELANKPYLQESYGTVSWTVRAIYTNYLGWFDGNATNLFPLSPVAEAQRIAQLTGGKEELLQAARDALEAQDYQWTSQLADYLIVLQFHTLEAKLLKAEALTALAQKQINLNAQNYYLSAAKNLRQQATNLSRDSP